jgi:hypothetical protein
MKLKFQKIKLFILLLLLTCSVLFVFCPIGKSLPMDPIYECYPVLVIDYDSELVQEPIIPYKETRELPVIIKARITGPAADIVAEKISGVAELIVNLNVDSSPEGVQATIIPPIIKFNISDQFVSQKATISIIVNKDLPAQAQKKLVIRMESKKLGDNINMVKKVTKTQEVPFIIGYYPKISFVYRDGNVRNISPEETASFNFEIQNWGNSATNVFSEVVGLPEGWTAEIVHNTTLGSDLVNGTNKKTISFRVKSPIDFGYHEDRAIIRVSMTPISKTSEAAGEPHYLYFIVQSNGFSTPGFETGILFIAIILILLPMIIKKKRKNQTKKQDGDRR